MQIAPPRAAIAGLADILTLTPQGLYRPAGDFHIDPRGRLPRALLTPGHSDHARPGMAGCLCTDLAVPVTRHRPGPVFEIALDAVAAGPRHKSGIALRFPRIARRRQDSAGIRDRHPERSASPFAPEDVIGADRRENTLFADRRFSPCRTRPMVNLSQGTTESR